MKKHASWVSILCLLIALVSVLTACNGNKGGTTPTTPSVTNPDGQPAEILQDLHEKKDISRDMKILSDYVPGDDIHEMNGDPVWDAEVGNYLFAEEKFDVTLSYVAPAAGQTTEVPAAEAPSGAEVPAELPADAETAA